MKLFKAIAVFFVSLFFLLLGTKESLALNEFSIDSTVRYNVQDSGRTIVSHDLILENNFSTLYATTYTLSLQNIDAQNVRAAYENGTQIQSEAIKAEDKINIKVTFPDAVVGQGEQRHFLIYYENSGFAQRTGEVWEISIPKLSDAESFRSYNVELFIPASFGLEAYISPNAKNTSQDDNGRIYKFSEEQLTQTGITAGFGQFQVFSFNLSYHLENPLSRSSETGIAIPPDTAFQKVYFDSITPTPNDVVIDEDGNWIAMYNLKPRERIDVMVRGSVQIFASYRPFPRPSDEVLSDNLKETVHWQVNDPRIKALAQQYKTPKEIYDYVSTTLSYDFSRVQPNVQRLGALKALESPAQAICMEFTDLFIAIARAAGIPAREINGYAYTENPELQPLSLVADVLHSWPEYYDREKGAWIAIDPTWGSTTGGVDFFNKLDLRHFTFVVHGADSTKPYPPGSYKLGTNPQKDVYVAFGKLPEERNSKPALSAHILRNIPFLNLLYSVSVYNPGPSGLYNLYPTIYFDGKENSRNFIAALPPYSSYDFNLEVPFTLLGNETPQNVKVTVDGSEINIPTNKNQVIINSLLALFLLFAAILVFILIKLKKITFDRLFAKIRITYEKLFKKTPKNPGSP
jgi:transglutaminase-like putative cysteine protease